MELASPVYSLFCESFQLAMVPILWKTSTIVPVPKKPRSTEPKDFRPVALTSIIMKCMENLVLNIILPMVKQHLDPNQFAYRAKR